ncbi:MAG: ATP-binding protein [bacterium]
MAGPDRGEQDERSHRPARGYAELRWRMAIVLLVTSLIPCVLLLGGGWFGFGRIVESRARELHHHLVRGRAQAVASFLDERLNLLRMVASTCERDDLISAGALAVQLEGLNTATNGGFTDLGVIGEDGDHLAYVGPFDLADRNYREAEWFQAVRSRGAFISDVFLGFRQVPHCVIALEINGPEGPWYLRATISSDQLQALVRADAPGNTVDAFLINRMGLCQTPTRRQEVLDPLPQADLSVHSGVRDTHIRQGDLTWFVSTIWLNENRWALVVQQDEAVVMAPVHDVVRLGSLFALGALVLVGGVTLLAMRHLVQMLEGADRERETATRAFLRSAKLASVGELATGLAHEINNPLAIISAQLTNLGDLIEELVAETPERSEILGILTRCRRQVTRCGSVTGKLLQFGRSRESFTRLVDIVPRLEEIVSLMRRQAEVANVELVLDLPATLPPVRIDPIELEQVIVNLIKNALDAMPDVGGRVNVRVAALGRELELIVRDNGPGIPPEILPRVFEPFFTTKPVGRGTGLGLSVCHGIVCSWGGTIDASSQPGDGLVVRIRLPRLDNPPEGGFTQEE